MRELAGRTALVTGAAGGLGRHLVRGLQDAGMQVVVSARDTARLEGLGARGIAADLTDRDDVHRLAREAGEVDVLVNNAGIELGKRFTDFTDEDFEAMTTVNLVAPMILTRELVRGMLARGRGHVVFIASMSGKVGVSCNEPYAATKAGLIGLTRSLRAEYRNAPVGFSVVSPGFIADTGMWARTNEPAPRAAGEADPRSVVDATINAIRRDLGDVTVSGRPVRPLLAASVLVPGLVERASWRLGPNELFERRAGG